MSNSWQISRRTMLHGLGASLALPLLDVMESCSAAADTPEATSRALYLYFPNGIVGGTWHPKRTGPRGELLELNESMQALEPFREHLVVPTNMHTPRGNGHGPGTATWLTGHGYDRRRIDVGGASVDQIAARTIGRNAPLPSLELSLEGEGYFSNDVPRNNVSWSDANTPCSREVEPRRVFDRIVGRSGGALFDRSVIDLVREDASRLRANVGADDRRKLDEYLESIRSIERRLDFGEKRVAEIGRDGGLTDTMARPKPGIPAEHGEYVRLMLDLVVLAFSTGATRVCTFMLDHGQSNRYFDFVDGVQGTWHALSHYKDISGETEDDDGKTSWRSHDSKRGMFDRVVQWHHAQLAHLLGRMKSIREGSGTLLDNTICVYGSNLSDGHEHGSKDLPVLIAGGGAGAVRPGRHLDFRRDTSLSRLHLSVLNALGIDAERFAETDRPLEELAG